MSQLVSVNVVIEMYAYLQLVFFFLSVGIATQINQLCCVAIAFASQDRGVHHETAAKCFRAVIAFFN